MLNHRRCMSLMTLALAAVGCSSPPPSRTPIEMVKIDTAPGGGSYSATPPLSLHSKIEATSSANDLDNSGPKVSEPAKEKTKAGEAKFAAPDHHVGLTKHNAVPVGGNLHGYR
jgi:hypothetical protein